MSDRKIMAGIAGLVLVGIAGCAILVGKYLAENTKVTTIALGQTRVKAKVVDTPESRERGLSGTRTLAAGRAMLFVFDKPGPHPIWMKDMRYPLDILWLNEQKVVVHVEKYVTPDSYPTTYASQRPALYVLEVPSGFADENAVAIGSAALFTY